MHAACATGSATVAPDPVLESKKLLQTLMDAHGIDDSHGVKHAEAVLEHAEAAILSAQPPLDMQHAQAVRLAALLHDADDHKYFGKESAKHMANAKRIMEDAGAA